MKINRKLEDKKVNGELELDRSVELGKTLTKMIS